MNRELVLTIVLLALGAVAVYMYQGVIMDYAGPIVDPVLELVGMGGSAGNGTDSVAMDESAESDDDSAEPPPADELLPQVHDHLYRTVRRSVRFPDRGLESWDGTEGVSFSSRFRGEFPASVVQNEQWQSVDIRLTLRALFDGGADGSIEVSSPSQLPVQSVEFQGNREQFQLVFPGPGEYYRSPVEQAVEQSPGMDFDTGLPELTADTVGESRWNGESAWTLTVSNTGSDNTTTLYVTRDQPFAIIGAETRREESPDQTVSLNYRNSDRRMLSSAQFESEQTVDFDFQYGNDRLQNVRVTGGTERYEWVQLSLTHDESFSNGGTLSVKEQGADEARSFAVFDWSFDEEQLASWSVDIDSAVNGETMSMSLSFREIDWLDSADTVQLADVSDLDELSRQDLTQKFMPVAMMAMSSMNQSSQQSGAGSGEAEQPSDEAESTDAGQRDDESVAESETGSAPRDDEEADEASDETSPESTTGQATATEDPTSGESTEGDRSRQTGTEGPEGSGETIRYSSVGRFPMSNPPAEYEDAREAFSNGDFRKARGILSELVEQYPNSANTNYMLGVIYFEQGEFDEARPYLEQAATLKHDPQIKVWSEQYLERIDNKTE